MYMLMFRRSDRGLAVSGAVLSLILSMLIVLPVGAAVHLHHDLQVVFDPETGEIEVTDRIRLPRGSESNQQFLLADTLSIKSSSSELTRLDDDSLPGFHRYEIAGRWPQNTITVKYTGKLAAEGVRGDHGMPKAVLSPQGVFLDGASGWVPWFGRAPVTFKLDVTPPKYWQVISQGRREQNGQVFTWTADVPQDDIYLIGGRFHRYFRAHGSVELGVYLLSEDAPLAERYLDASRQYLDFYTALFGDYPYAQFAVIENRWQTGYGMPSFTLLGSRVLRLPFILHSSLPHEIVHNWLGNGVYVASSGGNWSEGLTAYLADHLIKEAQGEGGEYRRKALERYANYAAQGRDVALRDFRARHDDATQAVGYSKAMMLFHMLRQEMGDGAFVAALRAFWRRYRFQPAGFDQLATVARESGASRAAALDRAWLDRVGGPSIRLGDVSVTKMSGGKHRLRVVVKQVQPSDLYHFSLPVVVQTESREEPVQRFTIPVAGRKTVWEKSFEASPLRVDLDPKFDVFRLLDEGERPSSLGRLFGAKQQWLVVPEHAPAELQTAWRTLADAWRKRFGNVVVTTDAEATLRGENDAVWILGWDNRGLEPNINRFANAQQSLRMEGMTTPVGDFPRSQFAVVALDPNNLRSPLGFIGAGSVAAIQALARKLPHYGSYGRLVFTGDTVANLHRDHLRIARSPLTWVSGDRDPGPPPAVAQSLASIVGVKLRFD